VSAADGRALLGAPVHPYQLQLSVGVACALFPLRKRRPGFDKNSFGYHGDGRIYHGNRNSIRTAPSFAVGDTVGCGIIYPPLGKHHGKLFFTKNGVYVGALDIGVAGLLGLPWFPVVCLPPGVPVEFNFGHQRPFAFDVLSFEEQHFVDAFGPAQQGSDVLSPGSLNTSCGSASTGSHSYSHGKGHHSHHSHYHHTHHHHHHHHHHHGHGHGGHSNGTGSPAPRGDPWAYYASLAAEQEGKMWPPRHPKCKSFAWDVATKGGLSRRPAAVAAAAAAAAAAGAGAGAGGGSCGGKGASQYRGGAVDGLSASALTIDTPTHAHAGTAAGGAAGGDDGDMSRPSSNAGSRRNSSGDLAGALPLPTPPPPPATAPASAGGGGGSAGAKRPRSPSSVGRKGGGHAISRSRSDETIDAARDGHGHGHSEKDRRGGAGGAGGAGGSASGGRDKSSNRDPRTKVMSDA
jgi:hypothetical protein